MAKLRTQDGTVYSDPADISRELESLGVKLDTWSIGEDTELKALLAKAALSDQQKEQVLAGLDHYFKDLQQAKGYQTRDLIVLHADTPNLDDILAKFDRTHTHADDEVRYIVDGDGVFGFVRSDDSQVELTVVAGEYINVPAGTEHWFVMTEAKRIKAVRYFTGTDGWTPEYTGTEIRFQ